MTITVPSTKADFDQIHALNYKTFVEEIPQHTGNNEGLLIDKFHSNNNYIIAKQMDEVVAMVSFSLTRPFSLDHKLFNLDQYLPDHKKLAEIRLLAVVKSERKKMLTYLLLKKVAEELTNLDVDAAVISGTTREISFYEKIGFQPFGHLVGTEAAMYQPMYITINHLRNDFKRD